MLWSLVVCSLQDTMIHLNLFGSLSRSGVRAKSEQAEGQKMAETGKGSK